LYGGHKSDAGVDFKLIWISLFHNVVKRVRNINARFRCIQ
jgi:hypothetical protein